MEQQCGDFDLFPKELKSVIFRKLDSSSLGRLTQLNRTFSKILDFLGVWKDICLSQWELSPERKILHGCTILTNGTENRLINLIEL
jgi:hypothetical protein